MGKRVIRLPGCCLNRIRPHARVLSPPVQSKLDKSAIEIDQKIENPCSACEEKSDEGVKPGFVVGRKIMIVIDSSLEAKSAVQWALTHTVQNQDVIILLHVTKPSKQANEEASSKEIDPRAYELASSFKNMCHVKRPEVQTEIAVSRRKGKRPKNSGGSQKTRGGTSSIGAEEKINNMASSNDVGRVKSHWWDGRVLYPECTMHGNCSEKKRQEDWRIHDYY